MKDRRRQIILDYAKWTALSALRSGTPAGFKARKDVYPQLDKIAFSDVLLSHRAISASEFNAWHERETEALCARVPINPRLQTGWGVRMRFYATFTTEAPRPTVCAEGGDEAVAASLHRKPFTASVRRQPPSAEDLPARHSLHVPLHVTRLSKLSAASWSRVIAESRRIESVSTVRVSSRRTLLAALGYSSSRRVARSMSIVGRAVVDCTHGRCRSGRWSRILRSLWTWHRWMSAASPKTARAQIEDHERLRSVRKPRLCRFASRL